MESSRHIPIALVLSLCFASRCAMAYTLELPPIGTNIHYDFIPGQNVLQISDGTPSAQAFSAELIFSKGKHLRIIRDPQVESDYLVGIHINFHAVGIRDAFPMIHISFDESLSILKEDGSPGATVRNTAVGFYPDRDDEYTFAWDFHVGAEQSIYGLKWDITPDIAAGMQLPETVSVTVYWWGAQQVLVVPEPASLALIWAGIACFLYAKRPLHVPMFGSG